MRKKKLLLVVLAGVVVVAGAGWGVSTRLRSPADEAALRTPPKPSLVTALVERRKLVSTVVVAGTLEYGSPQPIMLAGVVGGSETLQRATRAPRPGKVRDGGTLMEVNGRPVFAFTGKVPMHRTLAPGTKGDDVRQLQRALRVRVSGVFDPATVAAVTRFYAKKGYAAQQPTIEARQRRDELRRAVQTAQEVLADQRKALEQGRDVGPLKLKLANAKQDLRDAGRALDEAAHFTPEDAAKVEAAEAAVRTAEEKLLEAEQEANRPEPSPTPTPSDGRLKELRVANARADLDAAHRALDRVRVEAEQARERRLTEARKAVRLAREALATADQALRQARQLSPVKLKVAGAQKDLAAARAILAEYTLTYGTTVPAGEVVFLPKLPARLHKAAVKAGDVVDKAFATVTSSTFVVSGSVETAEAKLLKRGLAAVIETEAGKAIPATVSSVGAGRAKLGSEAVLITPRSMAGLKGLSGAGVTVRVTVGATREKVLSVPVAAVVTAADGRPRVQVEVGKDRTKEVEVRTGLTADGDVEVTGELKEGDRVVVGGA
ncbi:peptidoglycan-binding protein [Nonomuraea sp. NPDC059007]|uniref:peptidoglycan-binding protein n=1 Tax=Nonomuraea sp. NPDC059007 TaxID=3346692 RepID=UPI00369F057A